MAKPNYRFDKRQRELSRQNKKEEKRLKKEARQAAAAGGEAPPVVEGETKPEPADPV